MALTKCAATVAANIAIDCNEPVKAGLEEVGIGYHFEDVIFTRDALNPRKITAITVAEGKKGFAVYNTPKVPFADSGTEQNGEGAFVTYTKTLNFNIPVLNADGSKNIVEPISKSRTGFVFVIPTKQKTADGGFLIIGSECAAVSETGGRNLTDAAKNGVYEVSMKETGASYETVCLTGATYADARATFDALLAAVI